MRGDCKWSTKHVLHAPGHGWGLAKTLLSCALVAMLVAPAAWQGSGSAGFGSPRGLAAAPLAEPSARYGHTMVTIGDSIYLFGGIDSTTGSPPMSQSVFPLPIPTNDLWKFKADHWEELTPVNPPPSRSFHSAANVNGKMYVSGGKDAAGNPLGDIWVYDPTGNSWTRQSPTGTPPGPRTGHQVVAIGNELYLFGGKTNYTGTLASPYVWTYHPSMDSWEKKTPASPSPPRHSFSAANVDGRLVVWGGYPPIDNKMYSYDPTTNEWSQVTLANAPATFQSMATVSAGNQIWTFGGYPDTSGALANVWEFNFTSNIQATASPLSPLPAARYYPAGTRLPAGSTAALLAGLPVPVLVFGGGRGTDQVIAEQTVYTVTATASNVLYLPLILRE